MFTAAVRKAFEKKHIRVIASLIMIPAAMLCIRELHSGWYMLENTWFSYLLTVLLFAVITYCGGVLVSSVGSFKRWKFVTGASAAAVLTWGVVTFLGVYTTLYVSTLEELSYYIGELLRYTAPMLLIALGVTLTVGALFTHEKKKS